MNYALTVYPLSARYRGRLETALEAAPTYLSLAELRSLSVRQAVQQLRGLKGARLVLPLEDQGSTCILPVLKAVAAASNASSIEVRYPDLHAERISRWQLAHELTSLARASVSAQRGAFLCRRELSQLLAAPRATVQQRQSGPVLYLNANLWFGVKAGGSVGHVAGVVNALNDCGYPVLYASAGGRTMIRPEVESIALAPPSRFGLPYELNYYTFNRMVVRQLRTLDPPRFIYQRMSIANCSGVTLSRHWGVPLVIEYNGSEVWVAKNWGRPLRYHELAAKAEAACLRHAHIVVTISEVLRDELVEKGVAPNRIVCYPNCIDPEVFDPSRFSRADGLRIRCELGVPPDAVMATFVGTFGQWHGADLLAQAIRMLVDEQNKWLTDHRVHFVLVGDGLKMPLVRQILGDGKYAPFVTLTGLVPQADAPAYLAASDVFISPHVANADGSRFFGSPTKLFEYMAMGKAIVASDLDQIGKVLLNSVRVGELPSNDPVEGESRLAILFPSGDIRELIEAMKFAVERREWRTVLGSNARREALAKYTWAHHTAAILGGIQATAA